MEAPAKRWLSRMPARWSRNGAIVALIACGWPSSRQIEAAFDDLQMTVSRIAVFAIAAVTFAALGYSLGWIARWSLARSFPANGEALSNKLVKVLVLGGVAFAIVVLASDYILEWRGERTARGAAEFVGQMVGALGAGAAIGYLTALVSRRGLRRTMSDFAADLKATASADP